MDIEISRVHFAISHAEESMVAHGREEDFLSGEILVKMDFLEVGKLRQMQAK